MAELSNNQLCIAFLVVVVVLLLLYSPVKEYLENKAEVKQIRDKFLVEKFLMGYKEALYGMKPECVEEAVKQLQEERKERLENGVESPAIPMPPPPPPQPKSSCTTGQVDMAKVVAGSQFGVDNIRGSPELCLLAEDPRYRQYNYCGDYKYD